MATELFAFGSQYAYPTDLGTTELKALGAQYLRSDFQPNSNLMAVGLQYALRRDHKSDGTAYHPAQTPDAEEPDVIYTDIIFPECIAYGSTGSPNYVTDKTEVESGAESRNARQEYPRHTYNIELQDIPANEQSQIMNIWHVCSGAMAGFLFLDPMDHTSSNTATALSGSDVLGTDQVVASAVGSVTTYPLFKYYEYASHMKERRIRYPKPDTLIVAVDGVNVLNWTYSYVNHRIEFTQADEITATLSRDGSTQIITGAGGEFSDLQENDLVYVIGWSNGSYNRAMGGEPARVRSVDDDNLVLERYSGDLFGGATFTDEEITITPTTPHTGAAITAGYYFYVPVRFDGDDNMEGEIGSGMRESSYTTFGNITLRELFE